MVRYPQWSEDQYKAAEDMLKKGASYSDVGDFLHVPFAVAMMRCKRKGLRSLNKPGLRWLMSTDNTMKAPYVPPPAPPDEPAPVGPIGELVTQACQFIRLDPIPGTPWQCCGHPQHLNWPYCDYHGHILYRNWEVIRQEKRR